MWSGGCYRGASSKRKTGGSGLVATAEQATMSNSMGWKVENGLIAIIPVVWTALRNVLPEGGLPERCAEQRASRPSCDLRDGMGRLRPDDSECLCEG